MNSEQRTERPDVRSVARALLQKPKTWWKTYFGTILPDRLLLKARKKGMHPLDYLEYRSSWRWRDFPSPKASEENR